MRRLYKLIPELIIKSVNQTQDDTSCCRCCNATVQRRATLAKLCQRFIINNCYET